MGLNKEQVIAILLGLFGASGPLANWLVTSGHMASADVQADLMLATILTPTIVTLVFAWLQRNSAKVAGVAHMSPDEQKEALNKLSDADKVSVAEKVPDVATVVVKDGVNGKLAAMALDNVNHPNVVTETQNEADAKKGTKV